MSKKQTKEKASGCDLLTDAKESIRVLGGYAEANENFGLYTESRAMDRAVDVMGAMIEEIERLRGETNDHKENLQTSAKSDDESNPDS